MEGETRCSDSRLSGHHSLHLCDDRMKMSLPKKKKKKKKIILPF